MQREMNFFYNLQKLLRKKPDQEEIQHFSISHITTHIKILKTFSLGLQAAISIFYAGPAFNDITHNSLR